MRLASYLFIIILFIGIYCCDETKKPIKYSENKISLTQLLVQQNNYEQIQIQQFKSGHLTVNVKVNNVKGRFIIDTGSSSTIIDHKHKKKFRLKTEPTDKIAKTAGGVQLKLKVSKDNIFEFGEYKLRNVKVSLANLRHINYSFEQMGIFTIDGIIGSDILISKKGIIDYETLTLYLKRELD